MSLTRLYFITIGFTMFTVSLFSQPNNGYLSLDGVDDFVSRNAAILPVNQDFTIDIFFRVCKTNAGQLIDTRGGTTGPGFQVRLDYNEVNHSCTFSVSVDSSSQSTNKNYIATIDSNWNHFAYSHEHSNDLNTFYLNGDTLGTFLNPFSPLPAYYLGRNDFNTNNALAVNIDEHKITSALKYYPLGPYTVPSLPLNNSGNTIALWRFNDGQGVTGFSDFSGNNHHLQGSAGAHTNKGLFMTNDKTICPGDTQLLRVEGGTVFSWENESSIIGSETTNDTIFVHPFNEKIYIATVSDTNGCDYTDSVTISIHDLPAVHAGSNTVIHFGDTTQLQASGADSYEWEMDSSLSCTSCSNPKASPQHTTTYTVSGTDTNGCKNEDNITVMVGALISGTIYNGDSIVTEKVLDGVVNVFNMNSAGKFVFVTSYPIDGAGNYTVGPVPEGRQVKLRAKPNDTLYPNTLKTYYPDEFLKINAAPLSSDFDHAGIDIYCTVIDTSSNQGTGRIWGKTIAGNFTGKVQGPGDPLNGLDVSLIDKSTTQPIAFGETGYDSTVQDSAIFLFEGIESDKTYGIEIDVSGIPIDAGFDLNITEAVQEIYVLVVVDSNIVSFEDSVISSIRESSILSTIALFPNPSKDEITLHFNRIQQSKVSLELFDLLGKSVQESFSVEHDQKNQYTIDVSNLEKGIYILDILIGEIRIAEKLIIQ